MPHKLFLHELDLFDGLSEEAKKAIKDKSIKRKFQKGSFIYQQGDENKFVYILIEGKVKTTKITEAGEEITIRISYPNEILGITSLYGDSRKVVTNRCIEDSLIWIISGEEFWNMMRRFNEISLNIIKILISRLRSANELIEDLSLKEIKSRLAHLLFNFVKRSGIQDSNGFLIPKFTHQEIASMIGSSRTSVSINMNILSSEGILSYEGNNIRIKDINKIKTLADITEFQ